MSPDDDAERQSTERILTFLEAFLTAKGLPFIKLEPQSADELFAALSMLEKRAAEGLRPIIHFDTHGGKVDGLYIAPSRQFVPWHALAEALRRINVETRNNLCVVSAACFSFRTIERVEIAKPTPFFMFIAPAKAVTFGFVEEQTFPFYEETFISGDIGRAHKNHLSPTFQAYLCERLLVVGLRRYLSKNCFGKGGRKRWRSIYKQKLDDGTLQDTPESRKIARRQIRDLIRPGQALLDRFVSQFLIYKQAAIDMPQLMAVSLEMLIRENAVRRRLARSQRKRRKIHHAQRRWSRSLRRLRS